MQTLLKRMLRRSWMNEMALALLIATAVTILAMYSAHLQSEGRSASARVIAHSQDGYFLAREVAPSPNFDLASNPGQSGLFSLVGGWHEAKTPTSLGDLIVTYVDFTHTNAPTTPGSVSMHKNIAAAAGLNVGDNITLFLPGGQLTLTLAEVFSTTGFNSGIDVGEGVLVFTGERQMNTHFLYQRTAASSVPDLTIQKSIMDNWHTNQGATVEFVTTERSIGDALLGSKRTSLTQARISLTLFLSLSLLTSKLLSFMENRKMLAIMKTLGLKRVQIAGFVAKTSLPGPVIGIALGGVLSLILFLTLQSVASGLTVPIFFQAALTAVPAIVLALLVPARMAQMGTVNEMMFERPIAMVREKVSSLRRTMPQLEPLVKQGVHFLRLEVMDGKFDGFIFRKLGDSVQTGEVVALTDWWWGMKTREYVAPVTGTVVYYEEESGVIGIGPKELLGKTQDLMLQCSPAIVFAGE